MAEADHPFLLGPARGDKADAQAGNGKRTKKFHGRSPKGRQKGRIAAILSFPENLSIMEIPSRDLIE